MFGLQQMPDEHDGWPGRIVSLRVLFLVLTVATACTRVPSTFVSAVTAPSRIMYKKLQSRVVSF